MKGGYRNLARDMGDTIDVAAQAGLCTRLCRIDCISLMMLGGRDASSKNCVWPRAPEMAHPAASVEGVQMVGTRRHARIQRNPTYFAMLDNLLPKMPLRSRKPWDDVSPPTSLLPARGFDAGVWGGRVLKHRNLLKASSLT